MPQELTAADWMDEAESAERAEASPQAVALWARAVSLCSGEQQHRCHAGTARCEHEVAVDTELASVARRILDIPTLDTRKSDALDFHEVSVWQLLAALRLAHRMGRQDPSE
ncbi:MAG: hypothetical protein DWI15_00070 [Planctomycetota bacterium]|jgi:hypothetical protein|nr:MAG: hypothetical protein DWI15_00070 [Planctomycetota bacterium]